VSLDVETNEVATPEHIVVPAALNCDAVVAFAWLLKITPLRLSWFDRKLLSMMRHDERRELAPIVGIVLEPPRCRRFSWEVHLSFRIRT